MKVSDLSLQPCSELHDLILLILNVFLVIPGCLVRIKPESTKLKGEGQSSYVTLVTV